MKCSLKCITIWIHIILYIQTLCAAWIAKERNSSMSDSQSKEPQTEQVDITKTTVGQPPSQPQPPDTSSILIAQQNPKLDASPTALATDTENKPEVASEKKTGKFTVQRIPSTQKPLSELPENEKPSDASTNRVQPTESLVASVHLEKPAFCTRIK